MLNFLSLMGFYIIWSIKWWCVKKVPIALNFHAIHYICIISPPRSTLSRINAWSAENKLWSAEVKLWSAWHPDGLKWNNDYSTCHFHINRTIDPSPWFSLDEKAILRSLYGCIVAYNYAKINLNSNNYDIAIGKRDFQSSIITCSQFVNIFAKKEHNSPQ